MTACNSEVMKWNIFCVTGLLWGEFTGHRWIPLTKASDAELLCFLWSAPDQTVSKQSRRRWFETWSRPLWSHCNGPASPVLTWGCFYIKHWKKLELLCCKSCRQCRRHRLCNDSLVYHQWRQRWHHGNSSFGVGYCIIFYCCFLLFFRCCCPH